MWDEDRGCLNPKSTDNHSINILLFLEISEEKIESQLQDVLLVTASRRV